MERSSIPTRTNNISGAKDIKNGETKHQDIPKLSRHSTESKLVIIYIDVSSVPGYERGAWTKTTIKANTVFGFYDKEKLPDDEEESNQNRPSTLNSDWTTYFNVARNHSEANMIAFPFGGCVFYLTQATIPPRTEILADYNLHHDHSHILDPSFLQGTNEHLNHTWFTCGVCNIDFPSLLYVMKHVKFCNSTSTIYATVQSQEKESLSKLHSCTKMIELHAKETLYKSTKSDNYLNQHKRHINTNTRERDLQPAECKTEEGVVDRVITHTEEKPYKNKKCEESNTRSDHLEKDIRSHTKQKLVQCTQCDRSFTTKRGAENHIRTHTGEKPYQCEKCSLSFNLLSTLKKHNRTHTREKPYLCFKCGDSFPYSFTLKTHMLTHTREKRFKCGECEKHFGIKSGLKRHMVVHTNERPFQCAECNKLFASKKDLGNHLLIHTGEKSHKCKQCGKTFARLGTLKRHYTRHTGVKPCTCDECDYSCSRPYILKEHMRNNH